MPAPWQPTGTSPPAPQRTGAGLVNPSYNPVGASVWESSVQTLLPSKTHAQFCTPSPCLPSVPLSRLHGAQGGSCPQTALCTGLGSFSECPRLRGAGHPSLLPISQPVFSRACKASQEKLEEIFCFSLLGFPGARATSPVSPDLNHGRHATASSHPSSTPISLE